MICAPWLMTLRNAAHVGSKTKQKHLSLLTVKLTVCAYKGGRGIPKWIS